MPGALPALASATEAKRAIGVSSLTLVALLTGPGLRLCFCSINRIAEMILLGPAQLYEALRGGDLEGV
jgi:hypothetical protein